MFSINIYYKLRYLLLQNTDFIIIFKFILNRLNHPFIRYLKKKEKLKTLVYLKKSKLSQNYFSINSYYWKKVIKNNFKKFSYLEIGSFEGSSALFVLKNFITTKLYCVDSWNDKYEYKRFIFNLKKFKGRYKFFKRTSDNFFSKNSEKFDLIYVDGSHTKSQVFKDIKNSWKILNIGGLIICDDFFYGDIYKEVNNNIPIQAINKFYGENKSKIKVMCVNNNQIFFKKTKD